VQKFSDKYINKWNILTKAIVGFEFEFYTERSFYKLLELLNRELDPIKVHGFRKYHSDMKPDDKNFKIEPDLSGGYDMVELITGPLPYVDSKTILLKILKIMQKYTETNEKCSIHINISFDPEISPRLLENLNVLKIILNVDEDMIYEMFPKRKDNYYAISVKNIIPYKDFDFIGSAASIIENNIELPDTKYHGININTIKKGRLEYRYIGGHDYHRKTKEILELLDYFIVLTWNSIDKTDKNDREKLIEYLTKNINNFKKFKKLDSFIAEFPSIQLEVDKNDSLVVVNSYYGEFYDRLFDLISNIYNLKNCVINYDTGTRKLEIVDADFKTILDLDGFRFIDCSVNSGRYTNCEFVTCDIKNVHLEHCEVNDSDIYNSKLEYTNIDQTSLIKESYFYGGFLDGEMESGVFRSGKIGQFGMIGAKVKVITDIDNYFGLKPTIDIEKGKEIIGKELKKKF
jgi:hypothetical protein